MNPVHEFLAWELSAIAAAPDALRAHLRAHESAALPPARERTARGCNGTLALTVQARPLTLRAGDRMIGAAPAASVLERPLRLADCVFEAGSEIIPEFVMPSAEVPGLSFLVGQIRPAGSTGGPARRLLFSTMALHGGQAHAIAGARPVQDARPRNRFVRGTMIETPHGEVAIEDLEHGDEVLSRDGAVQLVAWRGSERISALELVLAPALRPMRIGAGALNGGRPGQDLLVAQEHRLVVDDWRATYLFGEDAILAPARSLLNGRNVSVECPLSGVEYFHLLTTSSSLVCANGLWAETLPGDGESLALLEPDLREEACRMLEAYCPQGSTERAGAAIPGPVPHDATGILAA